MSDVLFAFVLMFQSPRSGQICLNKLQKLKDEIVDLFQSPRSGQICLNGKERS